MHQNLIQLNRLAALIALMSVYASDVALAQKPCAQIRAACEQAGFVRGGASAGNGLQVDCLRPLIAGTSQRPKANKPLPKVDAQLITACKARNPNFGQGRRTPAPNGVQPGPASPQDE
jgi:hypothetical protein